MKENNNLCFDEKQIIGKEKNVRNKKKSLR